MSEGLRCVCEHARHKGERRPSTLPPAYRVDEPGLCHRYAMDQERGGLCEPCFREHPREDIWAAVASEPLREDVALHGGRCAAQAEAQVLQLGGIATEHLDAARSEDQLDVDRLARSLPEHFEGDEASHHSCIAYARSILDALAGDSDA